MAAINRDDVAHLARLAHIEMNAEELDRMAGELAVIVDSVKSVSEAAGDDVPATSHPIPLSNVFREDVVGHTFTAEQALSGAPDSDENRFKVPAILLLVSLAKVDLGDHHKKVLWRSAVVALVMLAVAVLTGAIGIH